MKLFEAERAAAQSAIVVAQLKVAITIDEKLLAKLDELVRMAVFRSRSAAIQAAVREKLERIDKTRLARECGKLDAAFEKALAEEGLSEDLREWPEY